MLLHCLPCILLQSSLVGVVQWGNAPKSLYLCLSINRKSTYQEKNDGRLITCRDPNRRRNLRNGISYYFRSANIY